VHPAELSPRELEAAVASRRTACASASSARSRRRPSRAARRCGCTRSVGTASPSSPA
jgi:hypothetical protein